MTPTLDRLPAKAEDTYLAMRRLVIPSWTPNRYSKTSGVLFIFCFIIVTTIAQLIILIIVVIIVIINIITSFNTFIINVIIIIVIVIFIVIIICF